MTMGELSRYCERQIAEAVERGDNRDAQSLYRSALRGNTKARERVYREAKAAAAARWGQKETR